MVSRFGGFNNAFLSESGLAGLKAGKLENGKVESVGVGSPNPSGESTSLLRLGAGCYLRINILRVAEKSFGG